MGGCFVISASFVNGILDGIYKNNSRLYWISMVHLFFIYRVGSRSVDSSIVFLHENTSTEYTRILLIEREKKKKEEKT